MCLWAALLSCAVSGCVRALPLRDGVSECLLPRLAVLWPSARLWEMALRDETPLSKLASGFGRRRVLVRPRGGMPADRLRGASGR